MLTDEQIAHIAFHVCAGRYPGSKLGAEDYMAIYQFFAAVRRLEHEINAPPLGIPNA